MNKKFSVGDMVKVRFEGGLNKGRTGWVIPARLIPTDGRGVPQIGEGHYTPLGKDDVPIVDTQGKMFTANRYALEVI